MRGRARYEHLEGDSAHYPYAARTALRRRQRRQAWLLRGLGAAILAAALLLFLREQHGGQPAPPVAPSPALPAVTDDPVKVTVRPATADVTADVLAGTGDADAEAHTDPVPEATATPETVAAVLPQYQALYEQNPDLVGWLRIEGTDIDYPVVQVPGDNTFYLRRGFDRRYATGGTLFIDGRCGMGFGDQTSTANWLLYGHNMRNGTMFGTLDRYADEEFFRDHPTFAFDTLYETGEWRVAAVLRTELGAEELPYYAFFDAETRGEWQAWMDAILPLALYDTGVVPEYGEQLLMLSTCGDHKPGTKARLAVVAVRRQTP